MKKSSILLALMTLSPAAFAQSYSGVVDDLNTVLTNPPENIQGTICAKTQNDNNPHSFQACSNGVAASRWMAEKYAQRTGQYLGCIDGLQQGIYDGYQAGKNPTQEMITDAQAYIASSVMQSAVDRASLRADQKGETESANEIISRYRKVVGVKNSSGGQVLPNKSPNLPKISFEGYTDGYENDVVSGGFDTLVDEGLISSNASSDDKFKMLEAYNFVKDNPKNPCSMDETIFGRRNMPTISWYELFRSARLRNFQNYGWKNGSWAWEVFDQHERNLDHYQNYEGMDQLEKVEPVTTPVTVERLKRDANGDLIAVLNTDGTHKVDADGNKMYEMEEVIVDYNTEMVRSKLTTQEVNQLKQIYRKSFEDAYQIRYAQEYASLKYHQEGLARYATGVTTGRLVGQKVAAHMAKKNAYDQRYKAVSKAKYAELAEKKYLDSFDRLISIFENNPVVELVSGYIDGTTNDNIYTPGEMLTAEVTVKNLGEVSRPVVLKLNNSISVISSQDGHTFNPVALDSTTVKTGVLGQISNDIGARENITVNMSLNNPSNLNEVASKLNVTKSQGITLREYAEIDDINVNLDTLSGKMDLVVKVINPSSVETPALPVLRVQAGQNELTKNMLKIQPEGANTVLVTFNNLDPLKIIKENGITGSLSVKLGDKITSKESLPSVTRGGQFDEMIAKYFTGITNGTISKYGSESKTKRLETLFSIIENRVDYAISEQVSNWKRQNQVDGTIIGELQSAYKAAKLSGLIHKNSDAQRMFDELTDVLARKVNNSGKSRIRGRDKFYLGALKVMSRKVSTKWRDYKN